MSDIELLTTEELSELFEAAVDALEHEDAAVSRRSCAYQTLRWDATLAVRESHIRELEVERDALQGAVEAVRAYLESVEAVDWGESVRDDIRKAVAGEALALLAAAEIEAGLATSRERPDS